MPTLPLVKEISFEDGSKARTIEVDLKTSADVIVAHLALNPKAVIPISGGAKFLKANRFSQINQFVTAVVELAFEQNIMLIDGGTRTGIMEIFGKVYRSVSLQNSRHVHPPLIGIVPLPLVNLPGQNIHGDELEPNHPLFILVRDATKWGQEVDIMFDLVEAFDREVNSLALIANGGLITLKEAVRNIRIGRDIIVLDSGYRATKVIFAALDGATRQELQGILLDPDQQLIRLDSPSCQDDLETALNRLEEISDYKKITRVSQDQSPDMLRSLLVQKLMLSA